MTWKVLEATWASNAIMGWGGPYGIGAWTGSPPADSGLSAYVRADSLSAVVYDSSGRHIREIAVGMARRYPRIFVSGLAVRTVGTMLLTPEEPRPRSLDPTTSHRLFIAITLPGISEVSFAEGAGWQHTAIAASAGTDYGVGPVGYVRADGVARLCSRFHPVVLHAQMLELV